MISVLRQLFAKQSEIRLLNIYKGLPISYDAKLSSVGDTDVRVISNRYQIACLYYQRGTYIQSDDMPYTISCQVISLNLAKEDAQLAEFQLATNNIGNRMNIRVEPADEGLIGTIQFKGYPNKVAASIADISIHGASVMVEDFLFSTRLFQAGNEMSMSISFPESIIQKTKKVYTSLASENRTTRSIVKPSLPAAQNGKIEITAWGKILAVRQEPNQSRYKVNIKFYIKDAERLALSQYISQRQTEIIRDLRILADELYSRKK